MFESWKRTISGYRRSRHNRRQQTRAHRLERLEDRQMMTIDWSMPARFGYVDQAGLAMIDRDLDGRMDMHLEPALEMIEKAVEAQPQDGYIVDSLGWAFYKLGRIEEAVATLEQAVMLRPNDAEINDHLGDAYWRAGRRLEARFQWNVAASVDEVGNVRERVAPKLASGLPEDGGTEDAAAAQ